MNKVFPYLRKPRLLQRIWKKLISLFYFEQWAILIARQGNKEFPLWSDFHALIPPRNYFWADPVPWIHNNQYYIFYEEFPFATNRGYIACITLDKSMNIISNQAVLQRPYHLSYPFIFEYNNNLYMLPETNENKTVEVYRCIGFPDCWELEKVTVSDIPVVDATLFEANNKWWLFANIVDEGGSSHDTLAFY